MGGKDNDLAAFNKKVSCDNIKRAMKSALVLSLVIPFFILSGPLFTWDNEALKNIFIWGMVLFLLTQICFGIVIYHEYRKDEFDLYHSLYLAYYSVTIIFMMLGSGIDMSAYGSEVFYIASCLYLVFVPVLQEKERLVFIAAQSCIIGALVLGFMLDLRCIADVCIVQLATVILSRYQHNLAFKKERMSIKLRQKTDSSEHDSLTGLYNRRGLESRTAAIWPFCDRNKISVGLIAIDIDYFKKYNDAFGHPKGDLCLKKVAAVLRESAKRGTDVVTRTGGEEFLIFVQDTDETQLISLAMKIRKTLESKKISHAFTGVSPYVTVSIGAAMCVPDYSNSFNKLYEEADKALYRAKQSGRNCVVFNDRIYGKIQEKSIKFVI